MSWISREDALARLGIKQQTLYAYVSRGRIRSRPQEDDPRASLYALADIEALLKRRRSGRARSDIARGTISWGEPVMETAITTVRDGRLVYRGRDAVEFSRAATLEDAAALLWDASRPFCTNGDVEASAATAKGRLLALLAVRAAEDRPGFGRSHSALAIDGASLLSGCIAAIAPGRAGAACHERLGHYLGIHGAGLETLRQALVLVADHELNASTFAARVAASTGGSIAAAALAGCATLTGPLHGEASARALAYLRTALDTSPDEALAAIAARGERVPAVGHALYPSGDPRAAALLESLSPKAALADAIAAAELASGQKANVDMALAAMTVELGLPDEAPFLIFASGRLVGWIAHAIEQLTSGKLIRPRATYTGV